MTRIPCTACKGDGEQDLAEGYEHVMTVMTDLDRRLFAMRSDGESARLKTARRRHGEWMSTRLIAEELPKVSRTLLSNRLAFLERVGLVDSRPSADDSRMLEWRLT
jgi:hypothetical protein